MRFKVMRVHYTQAMNIYHSKNINKQHKLNITNVMQWSRVARTFNSSDVYGQTT